jgi:hypothetical protein
MVQGQMEQRVQDPISKITRAPKYNNNKRNKEKNNQGKIVLRYCSSGTISGLQV